MPEPTGSQTSPQGKSSSSTEQPSGLTKDDIKGLQDSMKALGGTMGQLAELAKNTTANQQTEAEVEEPEATGESELQDTDLEMMSRAQFRDYMRDVITDTINKAVGKPLESRINGLETKITQSSLEGQIISLGGIRSKETGEFTSEPKYVDYWDWRDEMMGIARAHPNLSPERIYHLARAEGPSKAKALDEKYAKQKEDKELLKGGKGAPRRRNFGGLTPSGDTTVVKNQKMNGRESVETAFDEMVAKYGSDFLDH